MAEERPTGGRSRGWWWAVALVAGAAGAAAFLPGDVEEATGVPPAAVPAVPPTPVPDPEPAEVAAEPEPAPAEESRPVAESATLRVSVLDGRSDRPVPGAVIEAHDGRPHRIDRGGHRARIGVEQLAVGGRPFIACGIGLA